MKRAILGIGLVAISATALARPEQNAFINKPANTIPELLAQVKTDKVVLDRYMRHFSMSRTEVLDYIGSLRLGTIKTTGRYVVYSIPEDGSVKAHVSLFKAGTPAFVDSVGAPILRVKCGNPFVRGPKKPYAMNSVGAVPVAAESDNFELIPAQNVASMPTGSTMIAAIPPSEIFVEDVETIPEMLRTVPNAQGSAPTPQSFGGNQNVFGALGALGGVGAIASISNSGGGVLPNQPVPEPATVILLGVGAAALVSKRRRG